MTFESGAAMFNRCFKPAAIEIFTDHLRKQPNDYKGLMWRSKAFGIVNKPEDAMRDLEKAIDVSTGARRKIASAEKFMLLGNIAEFALISKQVTEESPECWEGWNMLGRYNLSVDDYEEAVACYRTALDVARENGETKDPEICWINHRLGHIWFNRGEIEIAAEYFKAAVESSPTHTVSHIGLCYTHSLQGNIDEARISFETAKELNQDLLQSHCEAGTFDDFLVKLQRRIREQQHKKQTANVNESEKKSKKSKYGGNNGGNGSGSGSGSDSDDNDRSQERINKIWKEMLKNAKCVKKYRNHKYVQSKCGKYWYSKDTARHGGAAFKRYKDTGSTLRFMDSLDENMQPMVNKHESMQNTVIFKSDMTGVKG